ncbi:hypothetical protein L1785_03115 [Antribacter sp. KLBMP9083]|uniref:Uncharacterized protein n=1 Tax=Antribacter soli TaxID=2910976 RepID=A0AA41QBX5_9MICO|nr:hypothetical protein [Antribacter soli]MCF4119960.1 hypothetical protein [Antribacter soli]
MTALADLEELAKQWTNVAAWLSALATLLTALIAVAAAVYAAIQVRLARLDRLDRNRPFVTISLRPSHGIVANIVIRNEGTTLARNVQFHFTPAWESSKPARTAVRDSKIWREGIPNLVPGQEIQVFADMFPDRHKTNLPRSYDVEVSCDDVARSVWRRKPRRLVEHYALDFDMFHGYSTATLYGIHDLADAMRAIKTTMSKWSESPAGRLSVVARDGDRLDDEERAEYEQWRAAQGDTEEGSSAESADESEETHDVLPVGDKATSFVAQIPITRPPAVRRQRSSGEDQ